MTRLLRYCLAFAFCILATGQAASASLDWENFNGYRYFETVFLTEEEIAALPEDWYEHVIAYEVGMRKDWIYLDDGRIIAYGVLYDSADDAALADELNPSEITDFFYFTEEEIAALPEGWEDRVLPYSPKKEGMPWRAKRDWIYLDDETSHAQDIRISYGEYGEGMGETIMDVGYFILGIKENLK